MHTVDEFEHLRSQNLALLNKLKHGQLLVKQQVQNFKKTSGELEASSTIKVTKNDIQTRVKASDDTSDKISLIRTPNSGKQKLRNDLLKVSPPRHADDAADLDGSYLGSTTSNQTRTSTPKRITKTPDGLTPVRSILKKRKIIDKNVKVASKYDHPDLNGATPKTNLNYSYSRVDDDDLQNRLSELKKTSGKAVATPTKLTFDDESLLADDDDAVRKQAKENAEKLMGDAGNDRKNASIVRELIKRPTSVLFSPDSKHKDQAPGKSVSFTGKDTSASTSVSSRYIGNAGKSLMGYDWIAGILDNEASVTERPDEYFEDLKEFRRVHLGQFLNRSFNIETQDIPRPVSPKVRDPEHTCIHTYSINDRLFTEPVNVNEDNKSFCPVCTDTRREPTTESPAFVRVSIPRSTLEKSYRVKPHRRKSFDPTDTCALSQHCLAGWETSRPSMLPTARNIDLRNYADNWQAQRTTTLSEAEKEASSYSHGQKTTRDLLNTSLSYRLQLMNLEKMHDYNYKPNSTVYPVY